MPLFYSVRGNFRFLLRNPGWNIGDALLAPPALQKAFSDPALLKQSLAQYLLTSTPFQANFHFLLHNPAWKVGDASLASPALQEAFFDPDVLVDWDTVDTVRLFRHVSRSKETTVSPRRGIDNGRDDERSRDEAS